MQKDPIQAFYEKYPYPEPISELAPDLLGGKARIEGCPSIHFHVYWPHRAFSSDLDILVAGCGTSLAPQLAVGLPEARIVAIDVSSQSIAHSAALCDRHGIRNVRHQLLEIEHAERLAADFDLIVCTGVLMLCADPDVALRALRRVLRRDGSALFKIYGKYGRAGLYYVQEALRRLGISPDTADHRQIDAIQNLVLSLDPTHPVLTLVRGLRDIKLRNEIADLFINPRDRAYSVPELYSLLARNGFALQEWFHRSHYEPSCLGVREGSLAAMAGALPIAERYAVGELLSAKIHLHQFIACRDDRPIDDRVARLDADDWAYMIPIKQSGITIDRATAPESGRSEWVSLPHYGQNGTRINFAPSEAPLFNDVDAHRSIAEIHAAVGSAPTREFWDRLYRYDLVFFRRPLS